VTSPAARLNWAEFCANPTDFEKLVKLLLQRLHPHGQAVDGKGGDEGREFEVRNAERLELWEAKSFTGRVSRRNPNRRRQVEESLKSAARHQPDAWHLVVPIDPDPAELAWFESLRRGDYPFIDQWCGRTWLESQLALPGNTDLIRYATEHTLLEYVRQYKLETEALVDGASTLLERHQALERLADEVNLYWRPIVGHLPDGTPYATVQPKRPDAAEQAPITFTLGVAIPTDNTHDALHESWRTSLELGTSASVPREFITDFSATGPPGLGLPTGNDIPDLIEFVAIPDTDVVELPTQRLDVSALGRTDPIASLTFHAEHRTTGSAGARITAYDPARTVSLVTDVRSRTIQLKLRALDDRLVTPSALLPSLRFARAVVPPNRLTLTISKGTQRYREDTSIEQPFLSEPPSDELVQFVEDLAVIQDKLRAPFPMPDTFTGRDAHEAHRLRRLVDGERVAWLRGPLTVNLVPDRVAEFRAQFAQTPRGWLRVSYDDMEVDFGEAGEHTVHTGPIWLLAEMSIDLDRITDGPDATAIFDVLGDGWMYAQRGISDDEASANSDNDADHDAPEHPPGSGRVAVRPANDSAVPMDER
jgi:hypothetical protein